MLKDSQARIPAGLPTVLIGVIKLCLLSKQRRDRYFGAARSLARISGVLLRSPSRYVNRCTVLKTKVRLFRDQHTEPNGAEF